MLRQAVELVKLGPCQAGRADANSCLRKVRPPRSSPSVVLPFAQLNGGHPVPRVVPRLSWFPVRLIRPIADGQITLDQLLTSATRLGFSHIELHHSFVDVETPNLLKEHQIGCSQLSCAPDITNRDKGRR